MRSPTLPAQTALFNGIHRSKPSDDWGTNHSTGKDKKKKRSKCLWPMPSANPQLNHCKIECRTNAVPTVANTTRIFCMEFPQET